MPSRLLNDPFNESTSPVSTESEHYLPVSIGSRAYMIDVAKYRRVTVDGQRQQIDQQAEPSEASLSSVGIWRRAQNSWSGGAGQIDYDFLKGNDREMFLASSGVDVLGKNEVSLLPRTQKHAEYSGAIGTGKMLSIYAGARYWVAESTALSFTAAVPAEISLKNITSGGTGEITSLATDGNKVFSARVGTGIWEVPVADSASTNLTATLVDEVGYANGRLIAIRENRIAEVSAVGVVGGAGQMDYEEPRAAFRWLRPVATSSGILVGGGMGHVWALYLMELDADGGLKPPKVVAPLPAGETLTGLYAYVNFVAIGTSRGVRVGQLDGDALRYGSAIETEKAVTCFSGFGEFIFFGRSSDAGNAGLSKIDLAQATADGRFAWAEDVETDGVSGFVSSVLVEPVSGVHNFTVDSEGLFQSVHERVPEGWLESSFISFGTSELKIARHLSIRHEALDGEVAVEVQPQNAGWTFPIGVSYLQGSFGSRQSWRIDADSFYKIRYRLRLTRSEDDATLGPQVTSVSMAALPTPPRVERFLVPILLFQKVVNHQGDGAEMTYNTLNEFQYLKDLESSKRLVTYREGALIEQVYIDAIEMQPARWNDDTSFFEGICMVQMYSVT